MVVKTKDNAQYLLNKIIHDLKTPTVAQINALELFLSACGEKLNTEEKDLIELTLNSCMQVQKLIENYNCVYNPDFENLKLNYEKFDISEITKEILCEFEILLKYSNLKSEFDYKELIVCADKSQIQRTIENILFYIINTSFKNSEIKISLLKSKNNIVFCAKNNSTYIPFEEMNKLFRAEIHFSNYNKTAQNLALHLSKKIILAHCGKIIAHSYPNNTTILGFEIPIK